MTGSTIASGMPAPHLDEQNRAGRCNYSKERHRFKHSDAPTIIGSMVGNVRFAQTHRSLASLKSQVSNCCRSM